MASAFRNATVLLLAAALLFIAASYLPSAKIQVHRFTPEASTSLSRRNLLSTAPAFQAALRRHHPGAASGSNISRSEIFLQVVARSKARAKALSHGIKGGSRSSKATTADYQTPVASINGAYTMEIMLGSPPQKFSAIADTGSDLVWVQCKPCSGCYSQSGPLFDPKSSSSFAKLSCKTSTCQNLLASACSKAGTCIYGYQYGDSSSSQGDLATEKVTLAGKDGSKSSFSSFKFGCGRLNSGSFGGAAGIVGLGQGALSLATQLSSAIQNKFSYCLVDFDDDSSKTSPLIFGSSASTGKNSFSTPILPNAGRSTYYFVGLEKISVGGKALNLATRTVKHASKAQQQQQQAYTLEVNSGGTIFDSGTTLTLLDDSVYAKVKSAFSALISLPTVDGSSAGFDLCYDISSNKKYRFPSLQLFFKGSTFTPPQGNYFVIVDTAGTVSCLAMAGSGGLGLGIIGNLMQQNHHVLYDRAAGVISMSPAKCDSL